MIGKISKFALIIGIWSLVISPTISAETPAATESGTTLQNAIKDKVKEEIDAIKKAVAKRSFVGQITKIAELNLTLTTLSSDTKNVTLSTNTTVKLPSGKEGTIKDLKEKDYLIAMGDVDSAGTLTAKRLVVIPKPSPDTRQVLFGKVTKATTTLLTLEASDKTIISLKILSDTKFSTKSKITSAKDIKNGFVVIAVAKPATAKSTFTASRLFVTPSVEISLTPTPTPTTKP